MTYLQKTFVRHAHPRHIILAYVGLMWGVYFMWFHNWVWALAAVVISGLVGRILTGDVREENLAQTTLGKILLLHMHPVNFVLQTAGVAVTFYGVWLHAGMHIMVGVTVILLGHLWGWHKVNDAL
jgi:hypothetical protein